MDAVTALGDDDLRAALNGQIEYLLREALRRRTGRGCPKNNAEKLESPPPV